MHNVIGLKGYDPVSYFDGTPTTGTPGWTAEHAGATYVFSTQENRERFVSDPDAFTPKYGGYCATAMSEGKFFDVDPTNFKVTDGNLYLFYRGPDGDTLPDWTATESDRTAAANEHWQTLTNA